MAATNMDRRGAMIHGEQKGQTERQTDVKNHCSVCPPKIIDPALRCASDSAPPLFSTQSATPSISAIRGVALTPVPVSTTTVSCSAEMAPLASSSWYAAAACAHVGST